MGERHNLPPLRAAILDAVDRGQATRWAIGLCPQVQAAAYRAVSAEGGTVGAHVEGAIRQLWQGGYLRRSDPAIAGAWAVTRRDYPPGPLQLAILEALREGPATTLDLVERTGGRRPSLWRAANRLVDRGLAEIVERRPARRGRPVPVYALTPS